MGNKKNRREKKSENVFHLNFKQPFEVHRYYKDEPDNYGGIVIWYNMMLQENYSSAVSQYD